MKQGRYSRGRETDRTMDRLVASTINIVCGPCLHSSTLEMKVTERQVQWRCTRTCRLLDPHGWRGTTDISNWDNQSAGSKFLYIRDRALCEGTVSLEGTHSYGRKERMLHAL